MGVCSAFAEQKKKPAKNARAMSRESRSCATRCVSKEFVILLIQRRDADEYIKLRALFFNVCAILVCILKFCFFFFLATAASPMIHSSHNVGFSFGSEKVLG